jgi:hypothetical protein
MEMSESLFSVCKTVIEALAKQIFLEKLLKGFELESFQEKAKV